LTQPSTAVGEKFFADIPNYTETRGWFLYDNAFGAEWGTTVDKMGAHDTAVVDFEWPLSNYIYLNRLNLGYSDGERSFYLWCALLDLLSAILCLTQFELLTASFEQHMVEQYYQCSYLETQLPCY